MEELAQGVLKKKALKTGAPRRIGTGGQSAMSPTGGAFTRSAQARIVQQNDTHAIVEVRCSCGRTIRLQCNYANQTQ
ncbi:MAG: hypothetical protein ACYSTL_07475 [Planctomycetota bacterium]|jgi:hypothetical protein